MSMGPQDKIKFVTDDAGNITEPTLSLLGNLHCDGKFAVGCDLGEKPSKFPRLQLFSYEKEDANSSEKGEDGVLNAEDDIYIMSSVYGTGAIVTHNGDVSFMWSSVLESGNCGVAVYGKNISLKSFEMATNVSPSGEPVDKDITEDVKNTIKPNHITLPADWHDYLHDSWLGNGCFTPKAADVEQYFADRGVSVQVSGMCSAQDGPSNQKYSFTVNFKNASTGDVLPSSDSYFIISRVSGLTIKKNGSEYVTKIDAPDSAIIQRGNMVPETVMKQLDTFGTIRYGDQVFCGMVYARDSFKADLGEQFTLTIAGALRAEPGSIIAECRGAHLNYDESNIKQLMPTFNSLTCKMWNCW